MNEVIHILDEMIEESKTQWSGLEYDIGTLNEAKSRIQALQQKVPTITIPEGTVLIGKDEYESLKEKAWRYDDLNK